MIISQASVLEVSLAVSGVIAAIATCMRHSRCTKIKCCGATIERDVEELPEAITESPV